MARKGVDTVMVSFRCPVDMFNRVLLNQQDRTHFILSKIEGNAVTVPKKDEISLEPKDFVIFFQVFGKNVKNMKVTEDEKMEMKRVQKKLMELTRNGF